MRELTQVSHCCEAGGFMAAENLALALDRHHQRIEISTSRWSSTATSWAGFPVEAHALAERGHLGEFGIDYALLGLCVRGVGRMEIHDRNDVRHVTSSPGRFSLLCRGYEQKPLSWVGVREMLYVGIGPEQLVSIAGEDSELARLSVNPQYAISDPHVVALVLNMRDEIQAGCPCGKLYGQALSLALAARLHARYGNRPAAEYACRSLSPLQLRRVCDYIHAHLNSDMEVAELARQVNLSPHHFSMLFKQATGVPPHRYVLRERILEAQRQLAAGRLTLSEVALGLGFSDQSHFSRAFRKITGTTPARYTGKRPNGWVTSTER
jgi:AraC family transcriptional regulator